MRRNESEDNAILGGSGDRSQKEHEVKEDMHKAMNVMMQVVMKMKMGGGFEEDGGAGGGRRE